MWGSLFLNLQLGMWWRAERAESLKTFSQSASYLLIGSYINKKKFFSHTFLYLCFHPWLSWWCLALEIFESKCDDSCGVASSISESKQDGLLATRIRNSCNLGNRWKIFFIMQCMECFFVFFFKFRWLEKSSRILEIPPKQCFFKWASGFFKHCKLIVF